MLEGLSVLISALLFVRLYQKILQLLRNASSLKFVPYTDLPLPFLATPLHRHFELLGWDRRRLVYGAWALGAGFAILGAVSFFGTETWERYLCRFLILIIAVIIWTSGSLSRYYFVGKHRLGSESRRRIALYYGYPYRMLGLRLYQLVEIIEANEEIIETPAEELALWRRMNISDARAMLGLYCYRSGYYSAALEQWKRINPQRPDLARLMEDLTARLALADQKTLLVREDEIHRQPPPSTGNLPPEDSPNPH